VRRSSQNHGNADEQSDGPKSRVGRSLMAKFLTATSVIANVRRKVMRDINPYQPSNTLSHDELLRHECRDLCPTCGQPISRWRIWNSITSGRCDGCKGELWLTLPFSFRLILVLTGIFLSGIGWVLSEYTAISYGYIFLIVPLSVTGLSCWMQIAYGTITSSTNRSINNTGTP
jgi:hypothetical protein